MHDFPLSGTAPIALQAQNKGSKSCKVSAVDVRAVATRTVAVIVALKDDGARYGALSILPFLVKQLIKLASVCVKDDQKIALRSSSREMYSQLEVLLNARKISN